MSERMGFKGTIRRDVIGVENTVQDSTICIDKLYITTSLYFSVLRITITRDQETGFRVLTNIHWNWLDAFMVFWKWQTLWLETFSFSWTPACGCRNRNYAKVRHFAKKISLITKTKYTLFPLSRSYGLMRQSINSPCPCPCPCHAACRCPYCVSIPMLLHLHVQTCPCPSFVSMSMMHFHVHAVKCFWYDQSAICKENCAKKYNTVQWLYAQDWDRRLIRRCWASFSKKCTGYIPNTEHHHGGFEPAPAYECTVSSVRRTSIQRCRRNLYIDDFLDRQMAQSRCCSVQYNHQPMQAWFLNWKCGDIKVVTSS